MMISALQHLALECSPYIQSSGYDLAFVELALWSWLYLPCCEVQDLCTKSFLVWKTSDWRPQP